MDLPTNYITDFLSTNRDTLVALKGARYFDNWPLRKLLIKICPLFKPLLSEPNVLNMNKLTKTGRRLIEQSGIELNEV